MGKVSGCYKVVSCLNLLVNRCNPFLPPDFGLVMVIATIVLSPPDLSAAIVGETSL